MSMGRGRGRNNLPGGQPPMQPHQPPHQGQDRRELRRPMQGVTPDDVTRGMARMDPFGNPDYGNYGNNGGNPYGMMVPPPRPAPSADGWSSGENQFDVYSQQHQQQQHQQQQPPDDYRLMAQQNAFGGGQGAYGSAQWNIGASEFVPKSNLSAAAAEFVPRAMPRNTSQWGYQNQPQPNYYQPAQEPVQPSYHDYQVVNPYMNASGGSSGGSLYNIDEQLSDAIATIVFMPNKLDRTAQTIAEKINGSTNDVETLASLVNTLIDRCFSEVSFQPLAGRFCAILVKYVTIHFDSGSMLSLLIEKCRSLHSDHLHYLSSDPASAKFIVEFCAHLLFYLDQFSIRKVESLVDILFDMFNTLMTVGCNSQDNLKTAAEMLKICGRALENDERRRNGDPNAPIDQSKPTPKVDQLMAMVAKISNDSDKFSDDVRKEMNDLIQARTNGSWGTEVFLPAMPVANEVAKPRSNAIVIEPDPNDAGSRNNVSSVVLSNNARNSRNNTGNEMVLTEEEMAFMNEHLAGSSSPGDSDVVGDRISIGGDEEDDMTDEIRAAYEVFLQEQAQQRSGNRS